MYDLFISYSRRDVASLAGRPTVALDWGTRQIVASGLDGNSDVIGEGQPRAAEEQAPTPGRTVRA
jgi:hypothetical protein